jgi:small subunit ribosomal protein S35
MSILLLRPSTTPINNPVMAIALQGFRLAARSCKCQPAESYCATRSIGKRRPFSATAFQCQEQEKDDMDPALRAALDKAAKGPKAQYGQYLQSEVSRASESLKRFDETALKILNDRVHKPTFPWQRRKEKVARTFMNEGEDEPVDGFSDYDDDEAENIPTLAHGELEHHREMRHYARLAAWEMPMLASKYPEAMTYYNTNVGGCWILDKLLTIAKRWQSPLYHQAPICP